MIVALSPEAEVAAIQQIGLILAALVTAGFTYLGVQGDRTRRHAKASRAQVENSHQTNLRDELDERVEGLACAWAREAHADELLVVAQVGQASRVRRLGPVLADAQERLSHG